MADFFDVWSGENQVWKTTVFVDWLFFCLFARVHQSGRLHLDGSRTVSIYTRSDGSLRKPRSGLPGQFENAASKSTLSIAQRSTRRCHRQIPGDMDILYAGKKCRIVSPSSWENRSIQLADDTARRSGWEDNAPVSLHFDALRVSSRSDPPRQTKYQRMDDLGFGIQFFVI